MKKIIRLLVISLVLVICSCTFCVSAETNKKEWTKMTGPATFSVTEDGCTMEAVEGVSFYKYTKDLVDIKDFSCTFTLEQDNWYDGHDGEHQYYYNITLADKAAFSGSSGLFLLLMPQSGRSLRMEGQILHSSYLLHPTYVEFDVDTLSDIVMHGKLLTGTGEGGADQYEISFDNCEQKYLFDIPENYQFHKAKDGKAFFSFGADANGEDNQKMTVKKVNGIDMVGKEETVASTNTQTSTEIKVENDDNVTNSTQVASNVSLSNGTLLFLILSVAVIFLVVVIGFVIILLTINKKFKSINKDS